jgi:hypothetical protein
MAGLLKNLIRVVGAVKNLATGEYEDVTYANPSPIKMGDSASVDAFGRLRAATPLNFFLNKNIHTRNPSQWEEPIVGAIIEHGAVTGGPFQVADVITGATSNTVATVTAVNAGSLTVDVNHNDFEVGETIAGSISGATAAVTTIGTGSNVSHNRNTASVILQAGAASGDGAIRQSHRYLPYVPGKSQQIQMTFVWGAAVANVRRRSGYFNGDNGLFIEQDIDAVRLVRRTNVTGTPTDTSIDQADWNLDTLDGNGPSRQTLDFTKIQLFYIDFQWLGAGRVRFGFDFGGHVTYCHEIDASNVFSGPYISTPSLPVKHEITNTGATAGVNTLTEICAAVVSEGGETLSGLGFTISNGIAPRSIVATSMQPVLAIRLKSTFGGGENRRTIQFSNASVYGTAQDTHFEISHVHDPSAFTGTWVDIGGGSAAEYSKDITAITGNPAHNIEEGYTAAGQAGKGVSESLVEGDKLDQHRFIAQNYDSTNSEVFLVSAQSFTGTASVYAHISWVEFE